MSLKRLQNERRALRVFPDGADIYAQPVSERDPLVWEGLITGAAGTPYEGGVFRVDIQLPRDYPLRPPGVHFVTKVFHPKITECGACDIELLCFSGWTPAHNIVKVLRAMQKELEDTSTDCPLVLDIATLVRRDPAEFQRKAREMTQQFGERIAPTMTVREALCFARAVRECHPLAISCDVQREMLMFEQKHRSPEVREFIDSL
jgi:ubiquitin-conjugating enzyme E2 D/E